MAATTKETETTNGAGALGNAQDAAQDAAELVRSTAERAASRLPEVAATAQVAARDTQRAIEKMPNQALLIGTSFSLGIATGLFIGGANRLLVTLAMAPAAAMGLTMLGRDTAETEGGTTRSRRTTSGG